MRRPLPNPRTVFLAAAVTVTLFSGSGCNRLKSGTAAKPKAPVPVRAEKPDIDFATVRPNELGYIPVLMYHEIGGKVIQRDPSLTRSVDAFRQDLQLLYDAGFRPVNLSDVVNNNIDVPAGMSPVVLTFDDARESQFRLIDNGNSFQIDPNSGMGVLDAFHKAHPDWKMRATFFVLPKSKVTMESFGQTGLGAQKLNYIVEQGMEIGNHTTLHKSLARMTPEQIQEEIGNADNVIHEAVPNAKIQTIALPMGIYPRDKKNWDYLIKGTYGGKTYEYRAAMRAAYRPIPSPVSKAYNPLRLERIATIDGLNGVRFWLDQFKKGAKPRYISDGDPNFVSVPKGTESDVDLEKLKEQNKTLYTYSPFGGSDGAKPIIGSSAEPKPIVTGNGG